jgi:hypothetical protein
MATQKSSAQEFWDSKMEAHPALHFVLSIICEVAGFFLNGHFLVFTGRWVIRVSGYVAETALLFAVLWISGTSVAPSLVELVMSKTFMDYLVMLAMVVLALIPEIILANAIINSIKQWMNVVQDHRRIMSWVWAILFTIPTCMFLVLTAITLNTLGAHNGNLVQISSDTLNFRMDAGWTYGLLEVVYAGVKKLFPQYATSTQIPSNQTQIITANPVDYEQIMTTILPQISSHIAGQMKVISAQQMAEFQEQIEAQFATLKISFQTVISSSNEIDMQQDMSAISNAYAVANDAHINDDMQPISTMISTSDAPLRRADLSMIEGTMYDKLIADISTLKELHMQSQMMPISEFVLSLRSRFSAYANFINEQRVCRVMEAISAAYPELNEVDMSIDMSPISEAISDANEMQMIADMSPISTSISNTNESDMSDDMPANITPISKANASHMVRKSSDNMRSNMSNSSESNDPNMSAKKGPYAITKEAASDLLKCSISEIERGISEGQIKPFAKDADKVLRSSLDGFVPQKRVRRTTKMVAVNN